MVIYACISPRTDSERSPDNRTSIDGGKVAAEVAPPRKRKNTPAIWGSSRGLWARGKTTPKHDEDTGETSYRKETERVTHTAELYTKITDEEYSALTAHQQRRFERSRRTGELSPHIRALAQYGITDIEPRRIQTKAGFYCDCVIIINLQRIANGGTWGIDTYKGERGFSDLANNFSLYMGSLLPCHADINEWIVRRIDYNIDLKLTPIDVERYIVLLQRGDKHNSWEIHETYEDKEKRIKAKHGRGRITHPTGSVLFDNKQYSVNIYNKQQERRRSNERRGITNTAEIEASAGILRIEIQVKQGKLHSIKDTLRTVWGIEFDGRPLEIFARYELAEPIIMKSLAQIAGQEDYCTLEKAKERIEHSGGAKRTRAAAIEFLEIAAALRSVWKAKERYKATHTGGVRLGTIMKRLKALNINPAPLPSVFGVDSMASLFGVTMTAFVEENNARLALI